MPLKRGAPSTPRSGAESFGAGTKRKNNGGLSTMLPITGQPRLDIFMQVGRVFMEDAVPECKRKRTTTSDPQSRGSSETKPATQEQKNRTYINIS